MARFKIGQKVVALEDDDYPAFFKKGDIVTIDKYECCDSCGAIGVHIVEAAGNTIPTTCDKCGFIDRLNTRFSYYESSFAPLANISDAIEYKLKVSIPELTEIKETQLQ